MNAGLSFILLVFAFVLFTLAAIPYAPSEPYHGRLIAAGLACWVGATIFGGRS